MDALAPSGPGLSSCTEPAVIDARSVLYEIKLLVNYEGEHNEIREPTTSVPALRLHLA